MSSGGLDLYAKVEDLLGVNEVTPILNDYYFEALGSLEFKTILDVGCGSGNFLADVKINYPQVEAMGIDLSCVMVERTKARGLKAECIDLCRVEKSFDVITAIFDMMNYLDDKQLKRFIGCTEQRLNKGGYFMFDINTLFAFKEIAAGSYINDSGDRFVTIDSYYYEKERIYDMEFTLFKQQGECFIKSQESIRQYYRTVEEIRKLTKMKLVSKKPISIYSHKTEKFFLIFKKM